MKLVSVNKLEPGLVVSENIFTLDDRLVLPKGTILDENDIEKIKAHSLYNIFVEDQKKAVPKKVKKPVSGLSYNEKLRNSEEFIKFRQHLEENAEILEETFRLIANNTIPLEVDKLTDPVYHLFVEAGGTAGIFDMLHNLRDSNNTVYMHSINVSLICNTLASWMRLPEDMIHYATAGGLLHDIGKVLLPQELVNKQTALSEYEERVLREHVIRGYDLIKDMDINIHIKNCVLMHHELRDGTGYPLGLKNDQIDPVASIVAIANVYDELTSQKGYRDKICPFTVIEQFENIGLDKYDTNAIMTFLSNIINTFIASRVMLNTGQVGDVIFINPVHLSRPVVKCADQFIDLAVRKEISIVSLV